MQARSGGQGLGVSSGRDQLSKALTVLCVVTSRGVLGGHLQRSVSSGLGEGPPCVAPPVPTCRDPQLRGPGRTGWGHVPGLQAPAWVGDPWTLGARQHRPACQPSGHISETGAHRVTEGHQCFGDGRRGPRRKSLPSSYPGDKLTDRKPIQTAASAC